MFKGNSELKVVRELCYLGVMFQNTGRFYKATRKASIAISKIRPIRVRARAQGFETRENLFQTSVLPTLLYAGDIWVLRYSKDPEHF